MRTIASVLMVLIILSGCQLNTRQTSGSGSTSNDAILEEAARAIQESNNVYFQSFVKSDSSIFIERYADDACILAPGSSKLCGREQIALFFKDAYESYGLRDGKFTTTAIYGTGNDFVTEEGLWQSFNSKGELFDDGKYLVLWKKTDRGWKMYRDAFSSNRTSN